MTPEPTIRGRFNTNEWNRVRYSLWAPVYDRVASLFTARRRRSVVLAAIQPGEHVLILGAGTGLDLDFVPRGAAITAIDITPAMIGRLEERARRLGLSVTAKVMDGQDLKFPDASFDVVLLHLIIAVIPDPVRCLREVVRVLRPGGRSVIFDKFIPDDAEPTFPIRLLQPVISFLGTEITRRLGPILASAGLRRVYNEAAGLNGLYQIVVCKKPITK
jgi:phosphatidylethanolamine/phosphatidyl-N-methylethanolamine N-methyltransferase